MDNKNKQNYKSGKDGIVIPVEGSIGLLALGAVGLRAWRKVKRAHRKEMEAQKDKMEKK